jgi:uncharacterized repeat protein (TIGR01451 family)
MRWFLAAALILLVALVLQTGLLAFAMYVLLGLLLVSRLLARAGTESLTAQRDTRSHTAAIGDELAVTLRVTNNGKLPVAWVLMEDLLPAAGRQPDGGRRLRVKGKRLQIRMVRGGGEVKLRYHVEFLMRGYYQIGPLLLESGDLFGLHRRYRVVTEPTYVLVFPRVVPLEGYELASRRPVGEVRLTHRLYEDPTRISGVREYRPGDPQNRVHWGATARTGVLHCKVYEPSTLAGVTILLDFHRAGYPSSGEPARSELAVTAAVSLAHAVYELGQQTGFATNAQDAVERLRLEGWQGDHRTRHAAQASVALRSESDRLAPLLVPTRRGPEQFERIRETLARVELSDGLTFAQLLAETMGRLPHDATVVALLPAVPIETALALGALARRGMAVTAVLVKLGDGEVRDQAFGRLIAEGVRDVRHLPDEAAIAALCEQQTQHAGPYRMTVELGD